MRSFNKTSPVVARRDYCIPPLERMDLDFVLRLNHEQKYLILRAQQQTDKTSVLIRPQDHLDSGAGGDFRFLYI